MTSPGAARADGDARQSTRRRLATIRSLVLALVGAVLVVAAVHSLGRHSGPSRGAQVATKLVTVVSSSADGDGVHVKARLDAPSPDGTSHQIEATVPASEWRLSHTLWACYPPNDPGKGTLRTPLDPECANLVGTN